MYIYLFIKKYRMHKDGMLLIIVQAMAELKRNHTGGFPPRYLSWGVKLKLKLLSVLQQLGSR